MTQAEINRAKQKEFADKCKKDREDALNAKKEAARLAAADFVWERYEYENPVPFVMPHPHMDLVEDTGEPKLTLAEKREQARIAVIKKDPKYLQFEMDMGIDQIIDEKFEDLDKDLDKIMQVFAKADGLP